MFTGLVSDVGHIVSVAERDQGRAITVATGWNLSDLEIGASVAHSGVCLSVVAIGDGRYTVEAWAETLATTTLGQLQAGDTVNLERSLRLGDELGGHLVSGHVDGVACVVDRREQGEAAFFEIEAPADLAPFIAPKGSVCLDGVSLTVNGVNGNRFDILAIRHTLAATTLNGWKSGARVNLEVDRLARYVARFLSFEPGSARSAAGA